MNRVIATIVNFSHLPSGSTYHGQGRFEVDKVREIVKERLAEVDNKGNEVFRKPGFQVKFKR